MSENTCSLCSLRVPKHPIMSDHQVFCCHGCQAVFQILSLQGALQNYREHPLFLQAAESGLISNPDLLKEIEGKSEEEFEKKKITLEVEGLWCPSCARVIQLILAKSGGVAKCLIDYTTDLGVIEYYPQIIGKDAIFSRIEKLGYHPRDLGEEREVNRDEGLKFRFAIAAFCTLNVMMFSYPIYAGFFQSDLVGMTKVLGWLALLFTLPLLCYSAFPLFRRLFNQIKARFIGMEALVGIGVASSFSLSLYNLLIGDPHLYFDTLSVIVTLVLLGRMMESRAKFSAKSSLFRLTRSIPNKGRRCMEGGEAFVPVKEIQQGDFLKAFSGEKVVLDGVLIEGEGYFDESLMTGESFPVFKKKGDLIVAGAILASGLVKYRVDKPFSESTWQKLVTMIEEELQNKTPYVRRADQIVGWFVPSVLILSLAAWGMTGDFSRTLSVLLISCPCALGIAAPLAESKMLHTLSEMGALVRNRAVLYLLGKETLYAFDKTGTITRGEITVVRGLENLDRYLLRTMKTLAHHSNHPISRAVSKAIDLPPLEDPVIEEVAGLGIKGKMEGNLTFLGSQKWMEQMNIAVEEGFSCYFAKEGQVLACLKLQDELRTGVPALIEALKPKKTVLLSGDQRQVVEDYAKRCGFDAHYFEHNPLQKREKVDRWKEEGEVVCFIGDGMNDSPSIAGADVGISVQSASDMTMQVADLILTKDVLDQLPKIHGIAGRGRRVIHQNLFWAFGYNAVGIVLAVFGYLNPILSAGAMALSSLFVVFNSKRA